ncbi:hypothetical protein DESC_670011 [Desulfosarcina cetonica]|nr:hypothetical protein DESC_670011 [Desulfosarcina cetonica]
MACAVRQSFDRLWLNATTMNVLNPFGDRHINPNSVWGTLGPALQDGVLADLTGVLLEVIANASLRPCDAGSSVPLGGDLYPPVHAPPGDLQSGKPAPPVRAQAARN